MANLQQLLNSQEAPNTIIMMTAADLQKLIDDTNAYTRRCIEEQLQPHYYDSSDLMRLLKIGRTTLYNWEREGKLPKPSQLAGSDKKLWDRNEIKEWIEQRKLKKYNHQ